MVRMAAQFLDQARIYVKGGDGGNGVMSFRRERYVPRGGPNGGNGGRGGSVLLQASPELNTLYPLHNQVHYRAVRGNHGEGADKYGANGEDMRILVPVGTLVRDAETGDLLADLDEAGQTVVVAAGGRGGRGNAAFKTARQNAPRFAEKGEPGQERWLALELKLVADVGIVGVPNAGKSTLLSVISAARPKIADYPFTTVEPMLGVAEVDHRQFVVADIPGLLEGAHEGKGLGLEFLRHVERTRILIHLLAGDSPDPLGDFEAINTEMQLFNPQMVGKPQIVAFNKMDLPEARAQWPAVESALQTRGFEVLAISAATRQNIEQLLYRVKDMLLSLPVRPTAATEAAEALPILSPAPDEKAFEIFQVADDKWYVEGVAIERAAAMTNWTYHEAGLRFQRILKALGISDALREAGIKEGDFVRIGDTELVWGYDNAFEEQ
jgi:GTP-binding protein